MKKDMRSKRGRKWKKRMGEEKRRLMRIGGERGWGRDERGMKTGTRRGGGRVKVVRGKEG